MFYSSLETRLLGLSNIEPILPVKIKLEVEASVLPRKENKEEITWREKSNLLI